MLQIGRRELNLGTFIELLGKEKNYLDQKLLELHTEITSKRKVELRYGRGGGERERRRDRETETETERADLVLGILIT